MSEGFTGLGISAEAEVLLAGSVVAALAVLLRNWHKARANKTFGAVAVFENEVEATPPFNKR